MATGLETAWNCKNWKPKWNDRLTCLFFFQGFEKKLVSRTAKAKLLNLMNKMSLLFSRRWVLQHEQLQRSCSCSHKIIYYRMTDNTALLSEYPHESHLNHPLWFYIKQTLQKHTRNLIWFFRMWVFFKQTCFFLGLTVLTPQEFKMRELFSMCRTKL